MPSSVSRRSFLGHFVAPAAAFGAGAIAMPRRSAGGVLAELAATPGASDEIARDERYWFAVQQAFTIDRGIVNFNNGGVCPSPAVVQQAMARNLALSNEAPAYTMWRVLEPQKEAVRERMARFFGCGPDEVAFTRNASESLQICQLGLDLEPGDEVLTTTHDYPRMITTFRQRERRDGIVLRQFPLPIPAEDPGEVVRRFEQNVTERTRLLLVSHMVNITGQILPVRQVVAMARARGIPAIVDGAHSFGHFPFRAADLDCDYFASSLHKWLFAPFGTGLLHVRRERIAGLWPLMAAEEKQDADIRKFEEIGTHPCPNHLAIADALTFHEGIGPERKAARLVYLRDRWARRLLEHDRVRLHTSLRPGLACGIATVQLEGVPSAKLAEHLWERHRIFTVAIEHAEFEGIRVSPSVYSTLEEVDRFAEAMEAVLSSPTAL
jgi:selenocysteine lyase/cysteine desulfurase